jgi:hypothetical protein
VEGRHDSRVIVEEIDVEDRSLDAEVNRTAQLPLPGDAGTPT